MTNPVLVEVTRGSIVESVHRGRVVVVDGDGAIMFSQGDVEAAVFPRSANKAMQALPLVESGAADAFRFGNRELALACSSHSGEEAHVALAGAMLKAAGQNEGALECGAHWSFEQKVLVAQVRRLDQPTTLHNNCSGKHVAFVCTACHNGQHPAGYTAYGHPVQRDIRAVMTDLTGDAHGMDNCGTDGCSIPTYAVPLAALARGFAKMASGVGLERDRARAARRIMQACMAEPFYVAGTNRSCTRLMETAPGRIFAKTGAEGVFCAAIPEKGIALALKCDDGAPRAADSMVAATLARYFKDEPEIYASLLGIATHSMHNWNRMHVGEVRVNPVLLG